MLAGLALCFIGGQVAQDVYAAGLFDQKYLPPEVKRIIEEPESVTAARCTIDFGIPGLERDATLGLGLIGPRRKLSNADAAEIRMLMTLPVDWKVGESACTFSPDHVIRFQREGRKVELVTCFTCSMHLMYVDGIQFRFQHHCAAMADPKKLRQILDHYSSELEKALLPYWREYNLLFAIAVSPVELEFKFEGGSLVLPAKAVGELFKLIFYDLAKPGTKGEKISVPLPEMTFAYPSSRSKLILGEDLESWQFVSEDTSCKGTFGRWRGKAHLLLRRALLKKQ